jgi:AraC family transcriptional regulator
MDIHIKNMVCGRCISAVKATLLKYGLHPITIDLGVASIEENTIADETRSALSNELKEQGFEVLDTAKSKILDRIKSLIIDKIHHQERLDLKLNWSDLIADELNHDYSALSALFSSVEGITIEQYIIRQKIERAKELIFYDEKNLSEIAFLLEYSSIQHFSTQFKKVTGLTPSEFKKMRDLNKHRKPLDSI